MPPKGKRTVDMIASTYGGFTFAPGCAQSHWTTSSKGTKKQKRKGVL